MNKIETAKEVYQNLIRAFGLMEFSFNHNDEKLSVSCVCSGEALRINVFLRVDPDTGCVTFYSAMPFQTAKDRMGELGIAVCYVNNKLKFGKFDIDLEGGMDYNFCNYYEPGRPSSPELLKDLISIALHTVDKYNEKFSSINSGLLSIADFIDADKGNITKN